MIAKVGSIAPKFTLKSKTDADLVDVSLDDYIGKKQVLLLFVPFAFTGVCTDELCSLSGGLDVYSGLDAEVLAISVDSPFAQEAWAKEKKIEVKLLSDFNKEVSTAYGVLYEDFIGFKGVAKRSAFVIGKDGKIKFASSSDDPHVLPPFEEIKAALKE